MLPRNMKMGSRGLAIDVATIDANKTGERTTTKRLPVPGYLPHMVVAMSNMRAQVSFSGTNWDNSAHSYPNSVYSYPNSIHNTHSTTPSTTPMHLFPL
jgi:hypothetical protein